jgi:predicted ATP-grasp superfamily ATP-dependent carboligase
MTRVLVAGVSTRAAAESAARAGFDVVAWDAFADADQHPRVDAHAVPAPFSPHEVARAARHAEVDAVAYLSPFENHPVTVRALGSGRRLWGNAPDVLRRVRDPRLLVDALTCGGCLTPGDIHRQSPRQSHQWLLKPLRSGGGQRIRRATGLERMPRGYYLQPFVEGDAWSIAFAAAGGRAVPLGMSRQIVGDPAFGTSGFRYCGSIMEPCAADVREQAAALACVVAGAFGLAGVNGIDFIERAGTVVAIEVNPRWSSSMEVIERATGEPVFGVHARACDGGELPPSSWAAPRTVGGKAIVFAREAVTIGDNQRWLADPDVRDVPRVGQRIGKGHPVCTVFATADDGRACRAALTAKASAVYERLAEWSAPAQGVRGRSKGTAA